MMAVKAAGAATTAAGAAAARSVAQASAVAHLGAHALGAAAYAVKAVALAHADQPELARDEVRWQLAQLTAEERTALRPRAAHRLGHIRPASGPACSAGEPSVRPFARSRQR